MMTIEVGYDEVQKNFPKIKKWVKKVKSLSLRKDDIDETKLKFYYSYGSFVNKKYNEDYQESLGKMFQMEYNERLDHELSKVRVSLTLRMGYLTISDRFQKGFIPDVVYKTVAEITKVRMLLEYEYHGYDYIKNTIPEVDNSIVSVEIIKDNIQKDFKEDISLNIDEILDKINRNGISSLSEDEKDFLDKKSKEQ